MTINMLDNASVMTLRRDGQYDICIGGSPTTMGDPISIVKGYWQDNRNCGYNNPELVSLADEALHTVDSEARSELYKKCFKIVEDDVRDISLFNAEEDWATTSNLSGVRMYSDGQFDMRWMNLA